MEYDSIGNTQIVINYGFMGVKLHNYYYYSVLESSTILIAIGFQAYGIEYNYL